MFASFRQRYPEVSTLLAAAFLAMIWTGVWIIVFLGATAILNLKTPTFIFVITLWFGVVAEAPIRWIENSNHVAQWSKPRVQNAQGDNRDYTIDRAMGFILYLLILPLLVFSGTLYFTDLTVEQLKLLGGEFQGAGETPSTASSLEMLESWRQALINKVGILGLGICVVMRTFIYKRKVPNR